MGCDVQIDFSIFAHRPPKKPLFKKISKSPKNALFEISKKKWVPTKIFESDQKDRLFEHFLTPGSPKSRKKFSDRFFRKVDPEGCSGRLFGKIGRKIFVDFFDFSGPKSAQKREFFGGTQKFEVEPTFLGVDFGPIFGRVPTRVFGFFRKSAFRGVECAKLSAGSERCFCTVF